MAVEAVADHIGLQVLLEGRTERKAALLMCKHILNAQVSIRAPCCKRWFDCAECHAEVSDHPLLKSHIMTMVCKKCKKAFRKDMADMESRDESDEYCPHCDNHFLREAVTREGVAGLGSGDLRKEQRIVRDDRVQGGGIQSKLEAIVDSSGRLG